MYGARERARKIDCGSTRTCVARTCVRTYAYVSVYVCAETILLQTFTFDERTSVISLSFLTRFITTQHVIYYLLYLLTTSWTTYIKKKKKKKRNKKPYSHKHHHHTNNFNEKEEKKMKKKKKKKK